MNAPVIYLPEAQADVNATYTTYEQRLVGLGERFLAQLQKAVSRRQCFPRNVRRPQGGVSAAPLRRFSHVFTIALRAGRSSFWLFCTVVAIRAFGWARVERAFNTVHVP